MTVIGLSSQQSIAFALVALAVVAFLAGLAYISQGRRRSRGRPDIPPAMQPGPSDPDLEKPRLEALQGWALVGILFLAIWIPVAWLFEPSSNLNQEKALFSESVERGRQTTELYSESNQFGVSCVRCHGENPPLGGGLNLYNGDLVTVPNLRTVCGGPNIPPHGAIHNLTDLRNTIMQGRPGTDMPSWSVRFAGALDDQQIQDIVNYIVSIQDVPKNQNVCTNIKAKGYLPPVEPAR
jgi:mono/diheme cytochrome c family protein